METKIANENDFPLESYFDNSRFSDFTIVCPDFEGQSSSTIESSLGEEKVQKKIYCHKILLFHISFFKNLFNYPTYKEYISNKLEVQTSWKLMHLMLKFEYHVLSRGSDKTISLDLLSEITNYYNDEIKDNKLLHLEKCIKIFNETVIYDCKNFSNEILKIIYNLGGLNSDEPEDEEEEEYYKLHKINRNLLDEFSKHLNITNFKFSFPLLVKYDLRYVCISSSENRYVSISSSENFLFSRKEFCQTIFNNINYQKLKAFYLKSNNISLNDANLHSIIKVILLCWWLEKNIEFGKANEQLIKFQEEIIQELKNHQSILWYDLNSILIKYVRSTIISLIKCNVKDREICHFDKIIFELIRLLFSISSHLYLNVNFIIEFLNLSPNICSKKNYLSYSPFILEKKYNKNCKELKNNLGRFNDLTLETIINHIQNTRIKLDINLFPTNTKLTKFIYGLFMELNLFKNIKKNDETDEKPQYNNVIKDVYDEKTINNKSDYDWTFMENEHLDEEYIDYDREDDE